MNEKRYWTFKFLARLTVVFLHIAVPPSGANVPDRNLSPLTISNNGSPKPIMPIHSNPTIQFDVVMDPLPRFPGKMSRHGISSGHVVVQVSVTDDGRLEDWIAIEAADRSFVKEVEKVIWDWGFGVPEINGIPEPVCNDILITFNAKGAQSVMANTSELLVTRLEHYQRLERNRPSLMRAKPYKVVAISDLDQLPVPEFVVPVAIPKKILRNCLGSEAVFKFFIDEDGNVRIPSLHKVSGRVSEEALSIAQDALAQWKFQSPTVNSRPVTVKAAQRFTFN